MLKGRLIVQVFAPCPKLGACRLIVTFYKICTALINDRIGFIFQAERGGALISHHRCTVPELQPRKGPYREGDEKRLNPESLYAPCSIDMQL